MATDLIDIQRQIEKLSQQADQIRSSKFKETVRDIQDKMKAFGISIKDLQGPKAAKSAKSAKAVKVQKKGTSKKSGTAPKLGPVAAKYRGPNDESWTGRGLTPKWLTTLVASGRQKEEFLIAPAAPAAA